MFLLITSPIAFLETTVIRSTWAAVHDQSLDFTCNTQLHVAHKVSNEMEQLFAFARVWHNKSCDEDMRVYAVGKMQEYFSRPDFDYAVIGRDSLKKIMHNDDMVYVLHLFEGSASGSIRGAFFANYATQVMSENLKSPLLSIEECIEANDVDETSRFRIGFIKK